MWRQVFVLVTDFASKVQLLSTYFLLYALPVLSKLGSEETTRAAANIFVVAYKKKGYSKQRNI
jgi:hypothetical protein